MLSVGTLGELTKFCAYSFVYVSGSSDDSWQGEVVTVHIHGFTTDWILRHSDFKSCFGNNIFVNTFVNK